MDGFWVELLQMNRNLVAGAADIGTGAVIGLGSLLAALSWFETVEAAAAYAPFATAVGFVGFAGILIAVVARGWHVIQMTRGVLSPD